MLRCLEVPLNNLLINYKERIATVSWSMVDTILTGLLEFATSALGHSDIARLLI